MIIFHIIFSQLILEVALRLVELMSISLSSLFGFLNNWYNSVLKLNATSRKSTDIIFVVTIIDRLYSLNTLIFTL